MNPYTFLITSLVIILIPGTGVIYTISTGISKGIKASIFAAFGCTFGILPHLCSSILLSSMLMKMSHKAFLIMKLMGALYLLYLGLRMLFAKDGFEFGNERLEQKSSTIIKRGILINLLNPKLTLFFFSFLPQYVNMESQNYVIESLLYGFVFMILTFVVFMGYGVLGGSVQKIINSPRLMITMQKLFGIIFIVFSIQLVNS